MLLLLCVSRELSPGKRHQRESGLDVGNGVSATASTREYLGDFVDDTFVRIHTNLLSGRTPNACTLRVMERLIREEALGSCKFFFMPTPSLTLNKIFFTKEKKLLGSRDGCRIDLHS